MVQTWEKYIEKNPKKDALKKVIFDISVWDIGGYDIKKLSWYKNKFRLRVWKIRVIFSKIEDEYFIEAVDTRWDIYKGL
jgi:mRNA-degrading endonuclease RelE of RelBE toxin-antitoxin system